MEPKTWTVIKFIKENTVAAVPSNWILPNQTCLWPPFLPDKVTGAIKSHAFNSCWPSYEVQIFRDATYDDYETARSKSKLAEECSDLNNTDTDTAKRRRPKILSTSEEEDEQEQTVTDPPKLPKKKRFLEHPSINVDLDVDNTLSQQQQVETTKTQQPTETQQPIKFAYNSIDNSQLLMPNNHQCTCCQIHGKFAKEILQNVHLVRSMVSDVIEAIKKPKSVELPSEESIFKQLLLPCETMEDLEHLELYLKDNGHFNNAAIELCQVGGNSETDFIKRLLPRLINNNVAHNFSWLGRKEKKAFNNMEASKLVIASANKCGFQNLKTIEKALAGWLKRAGDRLKYMKN